MIKLFLALIWITNAQSLNPKTYLTVQSLQKADFFRLTCTYKDPDPSDGFEVHIRIYVEDETIIRDVELATSDPGMPFELWPFTQDDLKTWNMGWSSSGPTIVGHRDAGYVSEDFAVQVEDGPGKIKGSLEYDNHNGISVNGPVTCEAVALRAPAIAP